MPAPTVRTKKKCCQSDPRCKRCPVVWQRLEDADLAERLGKRKYRPVRKLAKRKLASFRGR
ncbi:MAG: hypothetical protein H0U42_08325 [Thermoleophilaceae bacterium]|nr:hypothetical protein [Thermoleophilaceae bacterium]